MAGFTTYCNDLLARAANAGWKVVSQRSIDYGRQWQLEDKPGFKAILNAYSGKKGMSFHVTGRDAARLNEVLGGPAQVKSNALGGADPFGLGLPRIGGDESGKGDFFGPLVVAAFHLDAKTAESLKGAGIADSKKLGAAAIQRIAGLLDKTGCGEVVRLMPRDYNPIYEKFGNLNLLLADLHGQCVRKLLKRKKAPVVLIDEFARDGSALAAAIPGIKVITRTKGEADLAVAAASILARATFVDSLKELETEFGQPIPPGAGPPTIKAAREFVRTFGKQALHSVAKLHFKTMASL
jgi:ribonuclease HIII